MDKPGIEELLIGCVLDQQLLRRLQESPESVFAEYELSDQAREVLASPDERLLELLGNVVQQQATDDLSVRTTEMKTAGPARNDLTNLAEPAVAPENETDGQTPTVVSLAESRLALRLVPYLQRSTEMGDTTDEGMALTVNYAGHLDPLPAGTELEDLPGVPPAALPGEALPALGLFVAIQPNIWTDVAGNQEITFAVNARLPDDPALHQADDSSAEPAPQELTPWCHDMNSLGVNAAAAQVRVATAQYRYKWLLELIEVMVVPTNLTETNRRPIFTSWAWV